MNENKLDHKPYWKRIHHSWIFWIFLLLMLAGIIYYVMTLNFSLAPQIQLDTPKTHRAS